MLTLALTPSMIRRLLSIVIPIACYTAHAHTTVPVANTYHAIEAGSGYLIPYEVTKEGDALAFDDIIIGTHEDIKQRGGLVSLSIAPPSSNTPNRKKRAAPDITATFWPHGVIPYSLAHASEETRRLFRLAIAYIESETNIHFVERSNERDYLDITTVDATVTKEGKKRCGGSHVGQTGGAQKFTVATQCQDMETMLHELMHAFGFHHEHSRPDRDTYIEPRHPTLNVPISYSIATYRPFDFNSITHYSWLFRSRDPNTPIQPGNGRSELSAGDIAAINAVYPNVKARTNKPYIPATVHPRYLSSHKPRQTITLTVDCAAEIWHAAPPALSVERTQPECRDNTHSFTVTFNEPIKRRNLYISIRHPSGQYQKETIPIFAIDHPIIRPSLTRPTVTRASLR